MIEIDFNNISKSPIKKSFLEKIVLKTIARSGVLEFEEKKISLSFACVSKEEMKNLNKNYRKKNMPTDVLSFAEFKNQKEIRKYFSKKRELAFLGEIILCYNDIADYCRKNKLDIKKETAKVISHGILHLLGFRHGKKMFKIQDGIYSIK